MSRKTYHWLPGVLAEIAEIAGIDAALAIADKKGGIRAHFPSRAPDGHWLVELVGRENADLICQHFMPTSGGIDVLIPLGPKSFYSKARRAFHAKVQDGTSVQQAALELGIHLRTAHRYKAAGDEDDGQGRLL